MFSLYLQQYTDGMVGNIIWILLEIYFSFQQWKNFENLLRIDKVITMSLVYYFFGQQCSCLYFVWCRLWFLNLRCYELLFIAVQLVYSDHFCYFRTMQMTSVSGILHASFNCSFLCPCRLCTAQPASGTLCSHLVSLSYYLSWYLSVVRATLFPCKSGIVCRTGKSVIQMLLWGIKWLQMVLAL